MGLIFACVVFAATVGLILLVIGCAAPPREPVASPTDRPHPWGFDLEPNWSQA